MIVNLFSGSGECGLRHNRRDDSKPLHPGDEGCAADPHACRSALVASDSAFAFGQCANDLVMLLLGCSLSALLPFMERPSP